MTRLFRPNLIVFISNFCIMVLELVAGRIIAPYVGVSLYTWTSIIGIVLAGISLGNYIGGRLADRRASMRVLGYIFLFGGLTSLIILTVEYTVGLLPADWEIIPRILVLTMLLFFIPATILGMTSPIVAKLAVTDLALTGSTVGKIYAAGTAGSIAGTFATGFVLISAFGTFAIVTGVAIVLATMGALFITQGKPIPVVAVWIVAGVCIFANEQSNFLQTICSIETDYFCVRVVEQERDNTIVRKLVLDRLVHSFNSMEDPLQLTYGYEEMYGEITAYQAAQNSSLNALFIGGGGYTFPRYMETLYPDSAIDVIEIDPAVTQVAYDYLGLSAETTIQSFNQDARQYLLRKPDKQYDIIFGDAFNDFSVPYHLTTHEFNELIADWLADDGVYVLNMIDGGQADFLRAITHTLQQTFAHVYVAPTIQAWRQAPHSTFVILASNLPVDFEQLATVETPAGTSIFFENVLDSAETTTLLAQAEPTLLTDHFAPVEQLLAPAFRDEVIVDDVVNSK